jgi:hypothetical protein
MVAMSYEEIWREVPNYNGGRLCAVLRSGIEEHCKDCKHCIAALGGTGNVLRLVGDAAAFDSRVGQNNRSDRGVNRKGEQTRRTTNLRTVLYVDDSPRAQRMLTFALEWTGYKVVTVCNGEMLDRMRQFLPI